MCIDYCCNKIFGPSLQASVSRCTLFWGYALDTSIYILSEFQETEPDNVN